MREVPLVSLFLFVWKKAEHVPSEGCTQVDQAGNGGVGTQEGGAPGRKDMRTGHRNS